MNNENENYNLIIPADVKTRLELINGIGISELIKAGISFAVSTVIALLINIFINNFFVVILIVLFATSLTIVVTMRDKNNQSLLDMLQNMIKFYKSQKFYPYIVKNNYDIENKIIIQRNKEDYE